MCIRDRAATQTTIPRELRGGSRCHVRAQRENMRRMGPPELRGPRLSRCWHPYHHPHDSKDHGVMAIMAGYHRRTHQNHVAPKLRKGACLLGALLHRRCILWLLALP
eukprot:5096769-Alexandrium_andersonii.AAC.1